MALPSVGKEFNGAAMKFHALFRVLPLLAVSAAICSAQEKPFYLKDGDRVVFYGDSITDQRLYTTFTETFVVTRFPKLQVSFVHSGWGGDRVGGGGGGPIDVRLKRDVLAYDPTVMTIMLGMNDGSYRAFDEGIFDQYRTGFEHIIKTVTAAKPDLRITLIQPSPFDDVTQPPRFEGGYNRVLVRYGDYLKDLAQRERCTLADLNGPVVAALEKAKTSNAEMAPKIIPDRVHPGPAGHLLMAAELLKAWNAPTRVTTVEIDGRDHKLVQSKSTKISELKAADGLTWTQVDDALPMPVDMKDAVTALAINSSDFIAALDQQTLKVSGLSGTKYKLVIDDTTVGEFSADEFAQGLNLALLPTPMVKQAMDVHKLTLQHNEIHFKRWRQIQVPMASSKSDRVQAAVKELIAALDEEEASVVQQQRAAAKPVEHRYSLSPL
jgi:lysophospholipase L1-like esterase